MSSAPTGISSFTGLSEEQAVEALNKYGYNELPSAQKRSILKILFDIIKEPMFMLLIGGGIIYLILGDIQEALLLLFFVIIVICITLFQENRAERALNALQDLSSPRALVIRNGVQKRIPGREVVVGDLIIVREGDRVPADAVMLWGFNVLADESLLTGESISVRKSTTSDENAVIEKPGGDDLPFVFSGTLIVGGQGVAKVIATGLDTEIGIIGKTLQKIKPGKTPLQAQIGRLVKTVFSIAIILCTFIVIFFGLYRGGWLAGILYGITLAMAILPEEFPMVLAIFLAMGAWRLSQKKVLTRQMMAVETLGSATVLCVDKTGTLTHNVMAVKALTVGNRIFDLDNNSSTQLSEECQELIEYAVMAGKRHPYDPMEKALEAMAQEIFKFSEHLHADWTLDREYSLSKELLSMSNAWLVSGRNDLVIAAKGAPEAIAELCNFSKEKEKELEKQISTLAMKGLRVLGVAKAKHKIDKLPENQQDFDFDFIGLIGLADPIRENVPAAIKTCYDAGIRVIMITGDYLVTAQNIARQIGLRNTETILTGEDLTAISPEELKIKIKTVDVFARIMPEQKLSIINTLKSNGDIVAMTGDGVNDAPALKAADIGVAMGKRGTDVARESADLVVLDDDFSSIVTAVRYGRRIFDNLRKALTYIISVHVPIAGITLLPVLFDWPIILFPIHIVFLEMIIDPVCSIVFEAEAEEKNIMNRPPRNPIEPLFKKRMFIISFLQGLFSLLIVSLVLKLSLSLGQSNDEARTLTFITLVVSNLFLILTNRSWTRGLIASLKVPNRYLSRIFAGTIIILFLILAIPWLNKLFHFSSIHIYDLLLAIMAGIASIIWFELLKLILRTRKIPLLS